MPLKNSIRTNRREATSACSTYRFESNVRVSGTLQLKRGKSRHKVVVR